ncbi:hypothetical protein [Streptomyces avicenniae]|uniref:HflX-like GTP-binding protein n=1 Tax=Streptomyces avicenniae TaxID=500153 RepID=UPI001CBA67D9|nr:hypothetical protein [Streptomyces avicenniae]
MHRRRGRDRRPTRRTAQARHPLPPFAVEGADVVLVGFFPGRQRDFAALMDTAEREVTARGARVVGRLVQRRGVSAGGAASMHLPYSSRTLLSHGKVTELASLCERTGAEAALFLPALTPRQRQVLTEALGLPVVSLAASAP